MALSENLVKINLLRKGLDELRPLSKQAEDKLWEKLRLEWNYNSNHIEGNTLTYSETKLLLLFDKTTGDHEKREYDEMQAHDVAIHLVRDWAMDKTRDLTESDIKNLNKIILVRPYWKEALTYDGQPTRRLIKVGDYKEHPNSVRLKTGEMFHYAAPEETPALMQGLIEWYRTTDIQHPLVLAAELHYRFIRIHPFDDGNGRIARLLVNYILMKNDYTPIVVKTTDKENYITALQKADAGDKTAFHNYIAEQLKWSLELAQKAAQGEDIEESEDVFKEIEIWKKNLGQNKAEAKPKSNDIIVELYIKCLNSLYNTYHNKMYRAFYELFAEWDEKGWVNNSNSNDKGKLMIDERMEKLSQELTTPPIYNFHREGEEKDINSIELKINMLGFKKDRLNIFNNYSSIRTNFEPYKYQVLCTPNIKIEKLYGEWISLSEQEEIVSNCVKDTFKSIRLNMKNPPLSDIL